LQSLSQDELTVKDAFNLLDEMPQELWEHEAAMAIRIEIINVLVEERDEQARRKKEGKESEEAAVAAAAALTNKVSKALRQVGEALGKAMGAVDKMFDEGPKVTGFPSCFKSAFYQVLPLCAAIKDLSPEVMEVLLKSETLQLRSENDAYSLICAWLSQSPHISKRDAVFKQFLPLFRFHHMSRDFIGAVVSACPYADAYNLLPYIVRRSHPRRKTLKDRSMGDLRYIFKSQLELADLFPLRSDPGKPRRVHKHIGLAWGFPVSVHVTYEVEGTMGLYVDVDFPFGHVVEVEEEDERYAGFVFSIKAGEETLDCQHSFNVGTSQHKDPLFTISLTHRLPSSFPLSTSHSRVPRFL
jgi:hypothetical protein